MKGDLITIIKKEFKRFFGDKRLFFSTVLLPGLIIYVMYTVLGGVLQDQLVADDDHVSTVNVYNAPQSAETILTSLKLNVNTVNDSEIDDVKKQVADQETEMLMVFPENFDETVATYDAMTSGVAAPEIKIYYNSAEKESSALFAMVTEVFDSYEATMINKFDINVTPDEKFDLASEADATAQIFSMMVPMLLIMMLMSGCMAVAPESIAGEKERGTMATLLVTPAKRSSIALGKVISLATFALLSGLSSTLGVLLSLPKLMGGADGNLSASVYSIGDYVVLGFVVLSTVLAVVGVFAIVSTFAKSVKEAGSLATPVLLIGMVVAVTSSLGGGKEALGFFTIPVYNSALVFNGIFSMNYTMQQVGVCIGCNLVFMAICVFIMTKLFNSEKVMFSR